ncbi:MAG: CCA tRNA nucleotidyltransferase, partial [Candidatus Aenigmarchaeota archaeon]|nr:CCA tRNA nucleotidyltransferase [Candidatus Aenigmarchaeota archaeon]
MFLQKHFEQNKNLIIAQKNLIDWQKEIDKEPRFDFIKKLYSAFPKAEIYLVGGAVRDVILKRENKDFDFVIRNISAEKLQSFLKQRGKLILVGKTFGIFKFIPTGFDLQYAFDIALPRTDQSWQTGGYRDVDTQSSPNLSIDEDLARRDFTINALAWECRQHKLIDCFQGLKDIQNKIIRTVGKPEERFAEDYSRMLRGLRFSCQLDFTFEQTTWQIIKKNIKHLNDKKEDGERIVPEEVIGRELLKALIADPIKTINLFDQSGTWSKIAPELLQMKRCPQPANWHSEGDVWTHTKLVLEKLYSTRFKKEFGKQLPTIELIVACLFHDIAKPLTIKTPEKDGANRIRFDGHTNQGAKLF